MRFIFIFFTMLSTAMITFPAFSAWKLDNQKSQISFVSIKKDSIGESHTFMALSGQVDNDGMALINIDLSSVNTNIPVRDERMKTHLFEVNKFSQATFSTQLNAKEIAAIAVGSTQKITIKGVIDLHGYQQEITAEVIVVKHTNNKLLVSSLKPVMIKAENFDLVAGINKLKELAGLPSITQTVPVSFVLAFSQ